jgi:hypothetical protein
MLEQTHMATHPNCNRWFGSVEESSTQKRKGAKTQWNEDENENENENGPHHRDGELTRRAGNGNDD